MPETKKMKCPECERELEEGTAECPGCGLNLLFVAEFVRVRRAADRIITEQESARKKKTPSMFDQLFGSQKK